MRKKLVFALTLVVAAGSLMLACSGNDDATGGRNLLPTPLLDGGVIQSGDSGGAPSDTTNDLDDTLPVDTGTFQGTFDDTGP